MINHRVSRTVRPSGCIVLIAAATLVCLSPVLAQPDASSPQPRPALLDDRLPVEVRLASTITPVDLREVPARRALAWWSRQVDVALIINWDLLEAEGFDPDTPITLRAESAEAVSLLSELVSGFAGERRMIIQIEPWYVMVMSQRQANRVTELRVYDLGALVVARPDRFADAPDLSLRAALEQRDDRGDGDFFRDVNGRPAVTRVERVGSVVELIRAMIEPDVWRANGGEHWAIRSFGHRLLITAPAYVHEQIGRAVAPGRKATGDEMYRMREQPYRDRPGKPLKPVSGVQPSSQKVSGTN